MRRLATANTPSKHPQYTHTHASVRAHARTRTLYTRLPENNNNNNNTEHTRTHTHTHAHAHTHTRTHTGVYFPSGPREIKGDVTLTVSGRFELLVRCAKLPADDPLRKEQVVIRRSKADGAMLMRSLPVIDLWVRDAPTAAAAAAAAGAAARTLEVKEETHPPRLTRESAAFDRFAATLLPFLLHPSPALLRPSTA
jgi:hypothetical protein